MYEYKSFYYIVSDELAQEKYSITFRGKCTCFLPISFHAFKRQRNEMYS